MEPGACPGYEAVELRVRITEFADPADPRPAGPADLSVQVQSPHQTSHFKLRPGGASQGAKRYGWANQSHPIDVSLSLSLGATKSRNARILSGRTPRAACSRWTGWGAGSKSERMMRSDPSRTASAHW